MREAELFAPVKKWLEEHGYEIHVEVFGADIVAIKNGMITVVELKLCLTWQLKRQLIRRSEWADFVVAAVASNTAGMDHLRGWGFGLLQVAAGKCKLRLTPKPQPYSWHRKRAYRIKRLTGRLPAQPHETAGLPCCRELKLQRLAREIL